MGTVGAMMKALMSRHGFAVLVVLVGCSDGSSSADAGRDAAADDAPSREGTITRAVSPAAFTRMTSDPRTVQVSLSSEALGQQGFTYSASPEAGDPVFVDGWSVVFSRILLTVGNARLNRPGASPTDPSSVGAPVASDARRFAVEAHAAGALTGAGGGEETAIPLMVFRAGDDGRGLDATVRYAFSYDVVPATAQAVNVNLTADDATAYDEMIRRGWTTLVEGEATYAGVAPMAGSPLADYPRTVRFRYGYGAPAQYVNCKNPDNGSEETPGVQPSASGAARAQITFHMDHFFWSALGVEDPPLHFDPMAARAHDGAVLTLDDLAGVVITNLSDRSMRPVPDRGAQTRGYTPRAANLNYDTGGVSGIDDLRDFVAYSARASGHLNADGLCFVRPAGSFVY